MFNYSFITLVKSFDFPLGYNDDIFVPVKHKRGENMVSTKLSNPKGFEISLNLLLFFLLYL